MNLAWKSHLKACSEEWQANKMDDIKFFEEIIMNATAKTAKECLEIIGEKAAGKFDHWFTMRFGNEIPKRGRWEPGDTKSFYGPFKSFFGDRYYRYATYKDWKERGYDPNPRVIEAFHRAVLDRREPL
jgi:hypothetical protein